MVRKMLPIAVVTILMSTGCAHNQLLRLETQDFVVAAHKAESGGRSFYDGLIASDREFWVWLYEFDPSCTPESIAPSYVRLPMDKADVVRPLCVDRVPFPGAQPNREADRAAFEKQYASLAFVASYLEALSKAAADPELNASDAFKKAKDDLDVVLKLMGTPSPLSDAKTGAIADLAGFIEALSKDARSADDIRAILHDRGPRADAAFDALADWLAMDGSLANLTRDQIAALLRNQLRQGDMPATMRRDMMQSHFDYQDGQAARESRIKHCRAHSDAVERLDCERPEVGLMRLAGKTHHDLIQLAQGRMNDRQKARLMKLQRANFIRTASLYLDLVGVF